MLKVHIEAISIISNNFYLIKELVDKGEQLAQDDHYAQAEIKGKCTQLQLNWKDLNAAASGRKKKLEESLAFQQFSAAVGEEEVWLTEKTTISLSDDFGDSLAAVQVRKTLKMFADCDM